MQNIDFLTKVEMRMYKFFAKHESKWKELSMKSAMEISSKLRVKAISEGMLMEELTINQWLNKLVTNYK